MIDTLDERLKEVAASPNAFFAALAKAALDARRRIAALEAAQKPGLYAPPEVGMGQSSFTYDRNGYPVVAPSAPVEAKIYHSPFPPAPQPPPTVTDAEVVAALKASDPVAEMERAVGAWVYSRIDALINARYGPEAVELKYLADNAAAVEEYGLEAMRGERWRGEQAQATPESDAAEYAKGALQAVLASPDFDTAKCFAQAGLDLVTLGADVCAEMRGDKAQATPAHDGGVGSDGGADGPPRATRDIKVAEEPSENWLLGIWKSAPERTVEAAMRALYNAGIAAGKAEADRLREAMQRACDLLAERVYGNPARSPGHNARVCLEAALAPARPSQEEKS